MFDEEAPIWRASRACQTTLEDDGVDESARFRTAEGVSGSVAPLTNEEVDRKLFGVEYTFNRFTQAGDLLIRNATLGFSSPQMGFHLLIVLDARRGISEARAEQVRILMKLCIFGRRQGDPISVTHDATPHVR